MSRPSNKADLKLLKAGESLVREKGFLGFSIRELCQKANVNLGMFHYHFKSKNEFGRRVFEKIYEEFFVDFEHKALTGETEFEQLENALRELTFFMRDNGSIIASMLGDALCGSRLTADIIKNIAPRHLGIIFELIKKCLKKGYIKKMPAEKILVFVVSSVISSCILFYVSKKICSKQEALFIDSLRESMVGDKAILERISISLNALNAETGGKK